MRKLGLLLLWLIAPVLPAHSTGPPAVDAAQPQEWTVALGEGWRVQEGDNPAYARPGFDDSSWQTADLDNLGAAEPGWRWYRLHVTLPADHSQLALLIEGGDGVYAAYVNGAPVPGPQIRSSFAVARPTELAIPLNVPGTDLVIALRTFTPPAYSNWRLPLFMDASLGTPQAIETARQAMESARFEAAFPVIAVNLLLIVAGLGAFGLYRFHPLHPEYLWLGLYLSLLGLSDMLWGCQLNGVLPLSANFFVADPLVYASTIAQIEFTYSFGGRRVGRAWRLYEALLLVPLVLIGFTWLGLLPSPVYLLIEALVVVPVALLLPIFLSLWYRRGNREAGWLILPSLLPAAIVTLGNLGSISIFLGWRWLDFLDNTIPIGPAQLQLDDAGDLLFLLAIAVVMFLRFTRVSREQARTAAELDAAREIQQRLVPSALPLMTGYTVEAAYLPAHEVGGDFYQVVQPGNGSVLVIIGDVSGKGLKAAMTGALAIGALRALAAENLPPAVLLSRLNLEIVQAQNGGFITCLCIHLNGEGVVAIANAGHLSPYLNGKEIALDPALPLGLSRDVQYAQTALQLDPSDKLTLLSDGVVEAMSPDGQLYGFERTSAISTQSAQSIAAAAQNFGQEDDITVLTITRVGVALTV
jgi:phosphoserine phosphatase RsbU/P